MPPEIEAVFADCGTPLFPRSQRDMEMSCSCPDWEVPCKHLAAVCYVLAEAFDADPFAMLACPARGRADLLPALRRLTEARLRCLPAVPATAPDLLLRTFEPPAVQVRGKDLAALLAPAYEHLAG